MSERPQEFWTTLDPLALRDIYGSLSKQSAVKSAFNAIIANMFAAGLKFSTPCGVFRDHIETDLRQHWRRFCEQMIRQVFEIGIALICYETHHTLLFVPSILSIETHRVEFYTTPKGQNIYRVIAYDTKEVRDDVFVIERYPPTKAGRLQSPFNSLLFAHSTDRFLWESYFSATQQRANPTITVRHVPDHSRNVNVDMTTGRGVGSGSGERGYSVDPWSAEPGRVAGDTAFMMNSSSFALLDAKTSPMHTNGPSDPDRFDRPLSLPSSTRPFHSDQDLAANTVFPAFVNNGPVEDARDRMVSQLITQAGSDEGSILRLRASMKPVEQSSRVAVAVERIPATNGLLLRTENGYQPVRSEVAHAPEYFDIFQQHFGHIVANVLGIPIEFCSSQQTPVRHNRQLTVRILDSTIALWVDWCTDTCSSLLVLVYGSAGDYHRPKTSRSATKPVGDGEPKEDDEEEEEGEIARRMFVSMLRRPTARKQSALNASSAAVTMRFVLSDIKERERERADSESESENDSEDDDDDDDEEEEQQQEEGYEEGGTDDDQKRGRGRKRRRGKRIRKSRRAKRRKALNE